MSLRSRLVAGFLLVALVLIGADAVVAIVVHRSLVQSVDQRLGTARGRPARFEPPPSRTTPPLLSDPNRTRFVTDFYLVFINANGTVDRLFPTATSHSPQPPSVPGNVTARATAPTAPLKPFNVPAVGGGGPGYRAVAFRTERGETVFVAVSLHDAQTTYRRVLTVEGAATLAVLAALAIVAWFVLHLGVRPLDRVAETAAAIADGDLSRRVERAETSTEAGRLGLAFNTMVEEIERAFSAQGESEARLRRFIADASHELRTPLTSIRGYTELWRQGGLQEDAHLADAMRRVEQEAARMGALVEEMLLLARLDQGRPLEKAPVDLARIVADVVGDARAVEPDRPIALDAPDHLAVIGDENRLVQIVGNLLTNVRTHTPRCTPARVRLRAVDHVAVLDVEDDGPGLGPEPDRVFERFYRADQARSRSSGGSGLGLSIVAAVSEAHGGKASAGASPTGGASLHVELPLAFA